MMNRTAAIVGALVAICLVLAAVGWRERSRLELWLAMQGAGSNPEHPLIAMLGDSLVDSVNWRLLLHCDGIGNYGARGDTTAQMLARLPRILELKPKLLMAHCLIENVTGGFRADDWGSVTESGRWRQWQAGSAWALGARCWRRWRSATVRQGELRRDASLMS